MVALRNILSKLFLVKKVNLSPEEEEVLNRLMENIERALHYSLGKCNIPNLVRVEFFKIGLLFVQNRRNIRC